MFRSLRGVLAVALISCFMFFAGSVRAEITIAVVDVDYVLSQSSAAKSIKKQVEEKREKFIKQIKSEEDKLIKKQKEIEKSRKDISQEELIAKAKEFEKKRLDARKKIQDRKAKLDKAYAEAMSKLTKTIYDVCQKIADERKIDLVITRQNIIVGNMSLDITKDVAEKMNKTVSKISLNVK